MHCFPCSIMFYNICLYSDFLLTLQVTLKTLVCSCAVLLQVRVQRSAHAVIILWTVVARDWQPSQPTCPKAWQRCKWGPVLTAMLCILCSMWGMAIGSVNKSKNWRTKEYALNECQTSVSSSVHVQSHLYYIFIQVTIVLKMSESWTTDFVM